MTSNENTTKPPVPAGWGEWQRIPVDTTEGGTFDQVLRIAVLAADTWTFSERGPYETTGMTGSDKTRGTVRDALLQLLELGFIDIDGDRLQAAKSFPPGREEPGA